MEGKSGKKQTNKTTINEQEMRIGGREQYQRSFPPQTLPQGAQLNIVPRNAGASYTRTLLQASTSYSATELSNKPQQATFP